MRKESFTEETIIFISVFKWFFLATGAGAVVGGATFVFLKALEIGLAEGAKHHYYFVLMPVGFLISGLMVKYLAPDAGGHGTEKVIEAIHQHSARIKARVVPVKLVATLVTLISGGSVGREGPCAQIGAGITSVLANLFGFNDTDRKKLVICGISAGFASVFGTPIAGALFGIEVLFMGAMMYDVLLPSFVAGIVGYQVSTALGITHIYRPIMLVPVFSETYFMVVALSGVFFGLCSFLLIEFTAWVEGFVKRIGMSVSYRALMGGLILVLLTFIFSTDYLGLGEDVIARALNGEHVVSYAFLMKIVFTTIALSCGGTGGIITPIFFIGATAGSVYANVFGLDPATFAAIGFVSMLAGAANTPITASVMAVELFGPQIAPYAAIACIISFLMTGYRSIYPSQVVAFKKSASLDVEMGKVIEEINPQYTKRSHSAMGLITRLADFIGRPFKRR